MPELAEVFRNFGDLYREQFGEAMLPSHRRALRDIAACRTEFFGGQVSECDHCGHRHYLYHSCRNRSCPKCHQGSTQRWLEARETEVLPVPYAHAVFTLPASLRDPVRSHQKILLGVLMKAAAESLQALAVDPHYIGGQIGILAVLHTWGGPMVYHPHVHCLIPAGGLSKDGQWRAARKKYLMPAPALSVIFRAKFMALARKALPEVRFPDDLWDQEWVVYCKPAPQGRKKVLNYLARYVHRVAITNHRIVAVDKHRVRFTYKDSRTLAWTPTSLEPLEFIRRFLQHVLPKSFNKVRYYGFLSPARRQTLRQLQLLLTDPAEHDSTETACALLEGNETEAKPDLCPQCAVGVLVFIAELPRPPRGPP